jgi:hypothetical protein
MPTPRPAPGPGVTRAGRGLGARAAVTVDWTGSCGDDIAMIWQCQIMITYASRGWPGLESARMPSGFYVTSEFFRAHTNKVIANIRADLDLLSQFPALHQRTELAIYCSNASISYLHCAIPLDLSLALMPSLDTSFDGFMAATIHFEPAYAQSPAAVQYSKALQQL